MELTKFFGKIVVTFEHFDEMIEHSKVYGDLSQHLLHQISSVLKGNMKVRSLLVRNIAIR